MALIISIFLLINCKTKDDEVFREIKILNDEVEINKKKNNEGIILNSFG